MCIRDSLLKYDSVHGVFDAATVGHKDSGISVGGKDIAVTLSLIHISEPTRPY